eukprot:2117296-Ditylum_brightwellii.AAC.1
MIGSVLDAIPPSHAKRRPHGRVDELAYEQIDWNSSEFGHVQGKEKVPTNMSESRDMGFVMRCSKLSDVKDAKKHRD